MQKEIKTEKEIKTAVDEYLPRQGGVSGSSWFKIVRADPPHDGANWKISHSGGSASFAQALDDAQTALGKKYILAE